MKGGVVALLSLLAIISVAMQRGEAITCGQVDADLAQCVAYLIGHDAEPSKGCCDGVKSVKASVQSPADKRAACSCVKAAANRYTELKDQAAQSLPTKCNVELDIPVSRTVDCDKLN